MGARGPMKKSKSCSIGVGMPQATGRRGKTAKGKVKVTQGTLRHSE